ncbi:hypothetical protein NUSPORA_00638 [Nucleospora cyclopteri]
MKIENLFSESSTHSDLSGDDSFLMEKKPYLDLVEDDPASFDLTDHNGSDNSIMFLTESPNYKKIISNTIIFENNSIELFNRKINQANFVDLNLSENNKENLIPSKINPSVVPSKKSRRNPLAEISNNKKTKIYQEIALRDVIDLITRRNKQNFIIVDCRNKLDYKDNHIKCAKSIHDLLAADFDGFLLNKIKIIFYCNESCNYSSKYSQIHKNIDNCVLSEGFKAFYLVYPNFCISERF